MIDDGPGNDATYWEGIKRKKSWVLDESIYEFRPFIIETIGAFEPYALKRCTMIAEKKTITCFNGISNLVANRDDFELIRHDPLLTSISITVKRHNAHIILERQPIQTQLIESENERCHNEVSRIKKWATEKLA